MVAYRAYLEGLCSGCGQPQALAHHPDNDGWYEIGPNPSVCHACTAVARHGDEAAKPVEFLHLIHDRDYDAKPLPPLVVADVTGTSAA